MPYRRVAFTSGEYYHVYNRGSGREAIFHEAENYRFALECFKEYATAYQIAVIAYCLLPNHYHLLLRQDGSEPAGILPQRVFSSYTKAYNKRYGRSGTLFEGRFQAVHVDRDAYLLHLCRYIHANPVKHGIVSALEAWPYSNYPEWIGVRDGTLYDAEFVRAHFPCVADYARFVEDYVTGLRPLPDGLGAYLME